jgi:UDP-glucoronosyl and UDP-glucosyl transferase
VCSAGDRVGILYHGSSLRFVTVQVATCCCLCTAGNILMRPWIPQQDLLGHPAVKVFMTHGGIHSMYEALFHGQPMVLMPLGIDQFDNAR